MITLKENFYNSFVTEIKSKYFKNENHGTSNNIHYHNTNYTIECFSNGVVSLTKLIGKLSKTCKTSENEIVEIINKYIIVS